MRVVKQKPTNLRSSQSQRTQKTVDQSKLQACLLLVFFLIGRKGGVSFTLSQSQSVEKQIKSRTTFGTQMKSALAGL